LRASDVKHLSLTHIETLSCIARLGTFTAAAEKLHMTQSAISARMRELENTLGAPLFQRRGRRIELTMFGREFYERAEPMMHQMENLLSSVEGVQAAGRIRIGVGTLSMRWFAQLFRHTSQTMPGLAYDIEVNMTAPILAALEQGKLDLAIMPHAEESSELAVDSVGFEAMSWVISSQLVDALPTTDEPGAIQALLNAQPLWCVPKPSYYFSQALDGLRHAGATPRRVNTINNMAAAQEVALAGGGIALIGTEQARPFFESGALVPAFGPLCPPRIEYFITCRRQMRYGLLKKFIEEVLAATPRRAAANAANAANAVNAADKARDAESA
jgi:DNA-binding transcriptional LysR family regulator